MFSITDYNTALNAIGLNPTLVGHPNYLKYEKLWQRYFKTIVLPNITSENCSKIRVVLCESCPALPSGTTAHPHPKYIFNNLHLPISSTDVYLFQIYKGIKCGGVPPKGSIKQDVLIELVTDPKGPVIILDLFPFHGIKLTTTKRCKINLHLSSVIAVNNLHLILELCESATFNFAFATPPTIDLVKVECFMRNLYATKSLTFFRPTVNGGQGRSPYHNLLCNHVNARF